MVKFYIVLLSCLSYFCSCTKEVQIEIPSFKQKVVVEGRLFAGEFPVVLLSLTQDIYAPTDISNYLSSFISDATVYMSINGDSILLNAQPLNQLESEALARVAEMLEIETDEAALLPIFAYTTTNPQYKGVFGETYKLSIIYNQSYAYAETKLPIPVSLSSLFWKPEVTNTAYGRLQAGFQDPMTTNDAYYWEVKRIHSFNGQPIDKSFERPSGGYIRDKYWNGSFRILNYGNPLKRKDTTHLQEYKRFFRFGDQVVVRFSKMEYKIYEFFRTRREQIENQGNPFASPLNVKSNLIGNAVGIWAGFSPNYDTIICQP